MSLVYTPVYASLLGLHFIVLCFFVIRIRRRERIAFADGGRDDLNRAVRAHGNFIEYVPFFLILLAFFEAGGGSVWIINLLALAMWAGRILHAYGVLVEEPKHQTFNCRSRGMVLTFGTIIIVSVLNLAYAIF
jgi:uncharacterized membrane protein YecN with MAPEG domain